MPCPPPKKVQALRDPTRAPRHGTLTRVSVCDRFLQSHQLNRQTVALLTKYLLYRCTSRAVAVDQSFGARNLTHRSTKTASNFRDPLLFLSQSPYVSKPQPAVGFFRHTFWNWNPVGNASDQNSLGILFENILLEPL